MMLEGVKRFEARVQKPWNKPCCIMAVNEDSTPPTPRCPIPTKKAPQSTMKLSKHIQAFTITVVSGKLFLLTFKESTSHLILGAQVL